MHDRLILMLPPVGTTQQGSVGRTVSRLQRSDSTSVEKKNSYGESDAFSQKQHNRYKNGRIGGFCADSI